MSANAIVYCLEHLTDYLQFERLCSDLMHAAGYRDIEPLGGTNDRGRDALFISSEDTEKTTVFAYSVRADWPTKLRRDCKRIKEEGHDLNSVVFVCTAPITATERDKAVGEVRKEFDWSLELYGIERLRVLLTGDAAHLIAQHPSIFTPPFFPTSGGLSVAESHDTIVIDHVSQDHAMATWLARRLQVSGYRTWCYGTAPLAGENADRSVRDLIDKRAVRYRPVLSNASANDVNFVGRCVLAANRPALTLLCRANLYDPGKLPNVLADQTPCDFTDRWSDGIASVLSSLQSTGVHPAFEPDQGRAIALRAYAPVPVVKERRERVYANWFSISVPDVLHEYHLDRKLSKKDAETLLKSWPHVPFGNNRVLAFEPPPSSVTLSPHSKPASFLWRHNDTWRRAPIESPIRSLLYRYLEHAYVRAGMSYCGHRKKYFFKVDANPNHNVRYTHVDGRSTYAALTGEISWGSGERAKPFRYQICPNFGVHRDEVGDWWVGGRLYIRVTQQDGTPFDEKQIGRRRKKVVKSWWNKKWFAVTLAMMKALSQGDNEIVIGEEPHAVRISTVPLDWNCPVSIDTEALKRIGDFQQEMAELSYRSEAEDDE